MCRILLFCVFFAVKVNFANAQDLKFMTFNIRYATVNDGPDQWELRKDHVCDLVRDENPLAFGIQEGLHEQVAYMDQSLGEYAFLGVGRDNGNEEGEYCAIFYQKEALEVIDSGTFWLSETPDQPSLGWDASFKRICTYAKFRQKETNKTFLLLNTHFDHKGMEARNRSADLLIEKIKTLIHKGDPVILMGDFNLTSDTEAIQKIRSALEDTRELAKIVKGPDATFNGFDLEEAPTARIDYIFAGGNRMKVLESEILDSKYGGRYPSDHFPVTALIEFEED